MGKLGERAGFETAMMSGNGAGGRPGRVAVMGGWLVVLAGFGSVAAYGWDVLVDAEGENASRSITEDWPRAQVACEGQGSAIWSLAMSDDGFRLATATIGGEARLKPRTTGSSIVIEQGPMSSVRGVAFAPGGRFLAILGGGPTFRVWDLQAGTGPTELMTGAWETKCAAFTPDGALMAMGGFGGRTLELWDPVARRRVAELDNHSKSVVVLAFAPGGNRLVSGHTSGGWSLWDIAANTGDGRVAATERAHGRAHGSGIADVAFAPGGALFATAGLFDPVVRLWDASTGALLRELPGAVHGAEGLAFSPDGTMLAVACQDGTARLWDTARWHERAVLSTNGRALRAIAFDPTGALLATGGNDGVLRLWDVTRAMASNVDAATGGPGITSPGADVRGATEASGPCPRGAGQ